MFGGDPDLHVGTSSWSEKSWLGAFYPKGTAPRDFISYYSSRFDCVELDASFYAIPSVQTVRGWCDRTPPSFKFAAKMPRSVTHDAQLEGAAYDEAQIFIETIAELGPRLGPILLQFPYFNRKAFSGPSEFNERLDTFLSRLPVGPRYAIETRNPKWVGQELVAVCARHHASLAWTEHTWMLSADEWNARTGGGTTDFAYIRLLGDYKAMEARTDRWDQTLVINEDTTQNWSEVVQSVRAAGKHAWVFFNNHYEGHAPDSIERFRVAMGMEDSPPQDPQSPRPPLPPQQGELF